MNIQTEIHGTKMSDKSVEQTPKKPVRMVRWVVIIGLLLVLLVGGLWGFNAFRAKMIGQFFANMKPPPVTVSIANVTTEVVPRLLTGIGDLAAVHQVEVTPDVSGRVTKILFESGAAVKKGDPLVQLFDDPEQSDLASFKAQATSANLTLERAKALLAKQAGPQATVDTAQAAFDQANAAVTKTETIISQKLVRAPFDGELGVRKIDLGQFLSAGTQIVSLTDLSKVFLNFTITEKDRAVLAVGQTVRVNVDAYPGRKFEGKITTIDPQINSDTRNVRVQATLDNADRALKPGMFASTTVVLPPDPPVLVVPETSVDYTLYGDSVYRIVEKKDDKGEPSFSVERVAVRVGSRVDGKAVILNGLNAGDRIVAVGQLKLQPGAAVAISKDPPPPIPAKAPLN
ncbi:MAG: efflux transporter periplasmic adaptor subunit [Proteobacteria bacterium SG_bin9]|nr:MAG: efflux transporter periplasmic adaptor subunit [Proteobacteria bacterium SG_bin9]